jgi:hypothetical protein
VFNESQENQAHVTEHNLKTTTRGFFNIRTAHGKCVFNLKGDFTRENINVITRALEMNSSFKEKCIELDMAGVETITMQAMARLTIVLKALNEEGMHTAVNGLKGENLKLAHDLGMPYITQINGGALVNRF